jgi:hypothetical protein
MFARAKLRGEGFSGEVYISQTRIIFEAQRLNQPLVFSINKEIEWYEGSEESLGECRLIVYKSFPSDIVKNWLNTGRNYVTLASLKLLPTEYLHVFKNGLWLSVYPEHDFEELLHLLSAIVQALPKNPKEDFREGVNNLPENIRSLSKYFHTWAIGDDAEREEKIQKASKKRLESICSVVEPMLPNINYYLDSLKPGDESMAALRLGYLAEAVAEMQLRLQQ